MSSVLHRVRFRRDHRWAPGHMSAYLDRELASRGRARMERHAEECPECREMLQSLGRMLGMLQRVPRPTIADAPELVAAVRRRLHEPPNR